MRAIGPNYEENNMQEMNDGSIAATSAEGNGAKSSGTDQTTTAVKTSDDHGNSVEKLSASDATTSSDSGKQPGSAGKAETSRQNGGKSNGPKTEAGKAKSSRNSYKHGLCAQHLVRPGPLGVRDQEDYNKLASGVRNHYRPEGFIEEFLVEKIVTEMVRFARVIGHEQQALGARMGFANIFIDKILRYATSSERQLMRSIKELERVQMERRTATDMSESSTAEQCDEPPDQARPSRDGNWNSIGNLAPKGAPPMVPTGAGPTAKGNGETNPLACDPSDGEVTEEE
jgi:hypothetical protein